MFLHYNVPILRDILIYFHFKKIIKSNKRRAFAQNWRCVSACNYSCKRQNTPELVIDYIVYLIMSCDNAGFKNYVVLLKKKKKLNNQRNE